MTRFTEALLTIFTVGAIYFSLVTGVIPTPKTFHDEIVPVLPWWCLVTFGAYALATLGFGVYSFIDKEDKYKELLSVSENPSDFLIRDTNKLQEIDEAKTYLKKNGVDVE